MEKALSGGWMGVLIGALVWLFFSWANGIIVLRLVPPGIERFELTPQVVVMLVQCLLAGAIAGGATRQTERWVLAAAAGIAVGFGLGFIFVRQDDLLWGTIAALAMLLPVVFAALLSCLVAVVARMRE